MKHFWMILLIGFILAVGLVPTSSPLSKASAADEEPPKVDGLPLIAQEGNQPAAPSPSAVSGPTYYRTYSGSEFQPNHSDLTYSPSGTGLFALAIPPGGLSFRRPLDLPNGAQITLLTLYAIDNDATNNLTLQIAMNDPSSGVSQSFPVAISTTNAVTSPTVQPITATGSPLITLNTSVNDYALRYQPTVAGSSIILVGVRIQFSVPTGFLPLVIK